jgi:hypothetical protein
MAVSERFVVVVLALVAASGCKGDSKKKLGLATRDGGPPVIVVDEPVEGGAIGPLQREVEPNDERDRAAVVPVPGGVEGKFERPDDIDFYRIEAGAERRVAVRLKGAAADEGGVDLVLEFYDGDGKPLARSDRGPAGALEGLPNFALAKGAAYHASVSQFVKKGKKKKKAEKAEASVAGYQLTFEAIAPGADDEVEPNQEPAQARQLLLDEEKVGFLGWADDVDLWKLSLAGFSGGYGLDLAVDGIEGVGLEVTIAAPDGRVLVERKGLRDRGLSIRGLLPQSGAQFYLARISGSRSNPEQSYRIRSRSRALAETDEAEPNDDVERAIPAGPLGDAVTGERRGFLDGGDSDVYRFEAGREALGFTVSVEPPSGADAVLRVLSASGAEIARADNGKASQREEIAGLAFAPGEVRFVVVTGTAQGDEPDPYLLRWSSAVNLPAAPGQPPAAPGQPPGQPPPPRQPAPPDEPPIDDPYGE